MVCPHKKIVTTTEEKDEKGSVLKTIVKTTFGKCDRSNCPFFEILTDTCLLRSSGNNK